MQPKVVVLCGGKGTRAYPHTAEVPKPLLDVAGQPILQHVMEIYADQGFTDFVLAAGYRAALVEEFAKALPGTWAVDVVDTGESTNTGARIAQCRDRLGPTFFATYGDGVGDLDLHRLLAFHRDHRGEATMTVVDLPSPFGTIERDESGRVLRFREKPRLPDHQINAGFFVFDDTVFDHWAGDDLERDVLPALGREGRLYAYPHAGFWRSMDTYKDAIELTAACADGKAPWKRYAVRTAP